MAKTTDSAHLTTKTLLPTAINNWEMFMYDQGRSSNTVKAFLSDVRLLTQFLAPDKAIGAITTDDLNRFFAWMEKDRDSMQPQNLIAPYHLRKIILSLAPSIWDIDLSDPAEKVLQRSAISPLPQVLTQEEYEAVLLAADRHRRDKKPDARPYTLVSLILITAIKKK